MAALCSPSFSPTLQIPDKQFRFRTSISDSGQALQIPDQRFRFRTSDGQRQTFGVLEIRNSRSRRNACSLCCKSFHSDGQRQTTFSRQATGTRRAGEWRAVPGRSLLRRGRGALCHGGSLSESIACRSAAHPGAPAIGEERLGGPGRGGSGGPGRRFEIIRKFITKQAASTSAASRVPCLFSRTRKEGRFLRARPSGPSRATRARRRAGRLGNADPETPPAPERGPRRRAGPGAIDPVPARDEAQTRTARAPGRRQSTLQAISRLRCGQRNRPAVTGVWH